MHTCRQCHVELPATAFIHVRGKPIETCHNCVTENSQVTARTRGTVFRGDNPTDQFYLFDRTENIT